MAGLQDILAQIGLSFPELGGAAKPKQPTAGGSIDDAQFEELKKLIGQRIPSVSSPQVQGYAPGGPQINFTGGSPFPVHETPHIVNNSLILATQLAKVLQGLGKPPAGRGAGGI